MPLDRFMPSLRIWPPTSQSTSKILSRILFQFLQSHPFKKKKKHRRQAYFPDNTPFMGPFTWYFGVGFNWALKQEFLFYFFSKYEYCSGFVSLSCKSVSKLIFFPSLLGTYCTSTQMRMCLLVHGLLGWKLNILMRGTCVVVPHQVRFKEKKENK